MIPKKLQAYLSKNQIESEGVAHRTVYTAYDLAKTTGVNLAHIAKTILLKVEPHYGEKKSKHLIAVLPASHQLDLKKIKSIFKLKKVSIPDERLMVKLFKIKAGALTPFSALHGHPPVLVDKVLMRAKKILTRSGSFNDSLFLKPKDFIKATAGTLHAFAKKISVKK